MAHSVEIAGVQQCNSLVERSLDGGDAFGIVRLAVHAGHAHASESQRKHGWPEIPEFAGVNFVVHGFDRMGATFPVN